MNKKSTSKTFDDDAPITQSDIKSGKLVLRKRATNGVILSNKQRVNIYLDSAIIEHFKAMAGERGYQTLINDALKQALQAESIEATIKKTIREELRKH
ncbi:BrnA antitoxin family protein [Undibacterium flavidum]|uniref:BrnA antitoxin family protein n=1 Tax=Undibacterium flavidum TaxID=2762297 RepID=A0ABR6YCK5_9BURK|nr:BrnA antitoxin family protein [Undibacterium flavidum]MBC3874262.1 BrnA antitoxin family protein [Undibacterium flavidum]